MTHIVKRKGHTEQFDDRKVYASVYSACIVSNLSEQESEQNAEKVSELVTKWVNTQPEINSNQIFTKVHQELEKINKKAAFLYSTHRDIS